MSSHTAVIRRVQDERGVRAVVDYADDVIWIAAELMAEAARPDRDRIEGDLEVAEDLVSFGTEGEGLGRLRYQLVGWREQGLWHVAQRVP